MLVRRSAMFVASLFAILVVSAAAALAGVTPTYPPVVTVTATPSVTTPAVVVTTPAVAATTPAGVAATTVVPSTAATSPDTGVLGTSTSAPTTGATSSPDTAVLGTKVGNSSANNASGGLPHTGFEAGLLWSAVALLVIGLALLIVSRRRRQAS
jgi:LPXTG-motif cell wall-anchored protein